MKVSEGITEPLLMTPGPTRVPQPVRDAGARPMLHHRTAKFSALLSRVLAGLRQVLGTEGHVLPVHTTGRGAMVAVLCNLLSSGDELIACCNGEFGEIWAGFAEDLGLCVHRIATDWRHDVDAQEVAAAFDRFPSARAVTVAHCDSSTGVLNDVGDVASAAREHGAMVFVDAVNSAGGVPFQFDTWGLDAAVTASQKCLMASAGMAMVALSDRAWRTAETSTLPKSYWDFGAIRHTLGRDAPETPGSTPVALVQQLAAALDLIEGEGLAEVFARHEAMAQSVRRSVAELGLALQCSELGSRSPTLTAITAPAGIEPGAIRAGMEKRGILIAGGLGDFRSSAFRIGHLGDVRPTDVERTMHALKLTLAELENASTVPQEPTDCL